MTASERADKVKRYNAAIAAGEQDLARLIGRELLDDIYTREMNETATYAAAGWKNA